MQFFILFADNRTLFMSDSNIAEIVLQVNQNINKI